jgi:DNA glycosylase AlkZ-like
VTDVRPAVERVAPRRFRDEAGGELVDVIRAPLPGAEIEAPVRFLPTWDSTLLVHARRTQLLPERHRPRVFGTKTPHSVGTFLVDGQVAGAWRPVDGRIELEPYERLSRATLATIDDEARRLAAFHA